MKIEIKLTGLEVLADAIHKATDKIVAAIIRKDTKEDAEFVEWRDSKKYPGTVSASMIYKTYGFAQKEQTEIARKNRIKNYGTNNNPRWAHEDAVTILKIGGRL